MGDVVEKKHSPPTRFWSEGGSVGSNVKLDGPNDAFCVVWAHFHRVKPIYTIKIRLVLINLTKEKKKLTKWPKRTHSASFGPFSCSWALLGLQMREGWAVGDVVE
jgi:hypothetical protein